MTTNRIYDTTNPNWQPLEQHLGDQCAMWMWMCRADGLEFYKNIATRRYLVLDQEGNAYWHDQDSRLVPAASFHQAYNRAICADWTVAEA